MNNFLMLEEKIGTKIIIDGLRILRVEEGVSISIVHYDNPKTSNSQVIYVKETIQEIWEMIGARK